MFRAFTFFSPQQRVVVRPPVHRKRGREKRRRGPPAPVELLPETRLLASVDCLFFWGGGGGGSPAGRAAPSAGALLPPPAPARLRGAPPPLKRSGGAGGDPAGSWPAERPPDTREGLAVRALGPLEAPPAEERAVEAGGGALGARPPGAGPRGGGPLGGGAGKPRQKARGRAAGAPRPPAALPLPGQAPPPPAPTGGGAGCGSSPEASPRSGRAERGSPQPPRAPAARLGVRAAAGRRLLPQGEKRPLLPNASVAPHRNAESARKVLRVLPAKNKEVPLRLDEMNTHLTSLFKNTTAHDRKRHSTSVQYNVLSITTVTAIIT